MRETKYYKGYGIVSGDGLFNDIVKGVTSVLSSNRTKDVITEGAKAIARSAGDKAGTKLVEKLTAPKASPKTKAKPSKSSEEALKDIYGSSILGQGIRKI